MLSEVILILAGHPSSFLEPVASGSSDAQGPDHNAQVNTLIRQLSGSVRAKEDLPLHPGERAQLDYLASLAHRCSIIKSFAQLQLDHVRRRTLEQAARRPASTRSRSQQARQAKNASTSEDEPTAHMVPLCAQILRSLEAYDELVVELERRLLARDTALVSAESYVSLATIRAEMQIWDTRIAALGRLLESLVRGPEEQVGSASDAPEDPQQPASGLTGWTGGLLIDLLARLADTGVTRVAELFAALRDAVEDSWKTLLGDWVCHGIANGSPVSLGSSFVSEGRDALVELIAADESSNSNVSTWRLRPWALPSSVSPVTADAILYVGRAISRVKAHSEGGQMIPAALMASHRERLRDASVRPSQPHLFAKTIADVKQDVGEWLWRNVLTDQAVLSALQDLGNYFLLRSGTFSLSLLAEIDETQRKKTLGARTAAAAELSDTDLELALHRASVGTDLEDHHSLELLHWRKGGRSESKRRRIGDDGSSLDEGVQRARFDDSFVGIPAQLHYATDFPLDFFLSDVELETYSQIFSYLSALRRTHSRVLSCWTALSKSQRVRRKFTGRTEGGASTAEVQQRTTLLRVTWSTGRDMLWFLDTLLGHFQVSIKSAGNYERLV